MVPYTTGGKGKDKGSKDLPTYLWDLYLTKFERETGE
jgi:hypothetical protein